MVEQQGNHTRTKLLELLVAGRNAPVSGEALSATLGVTRAAVWKEIGLLRQKGYTIASATNRGYQITGMPNGLGPAHLAAVANGQFLGSIAYHDTVDSTITQAVRMTLENPAESLDGTVVLADCQTGGQGRMGRSFASPPGVGIYLSMIFVPPGSAQDLGLLTSYAGLAVCNALERVCGVSAQIKWPNDIIIGGKKVCGILTRLISDAETNTITHAVLGIGINVLQRQFAPELAEKAISVWQATGVEHSRAQITTQLILELRRMLFAERWLETPPKEAIELLRARSCTLGRSVLVVSPSDSRQGTAVDIAPSGALLVQFGTQTETVFSGEVSVRGVLGYLPEALRNGENK